MIGHAYMTVMVMAMVRVSCDDVMDDVTDNVIINEITDDDNM